MKPVVKTSLFFYAMLFGLMFNANSVSAQQPIDSSSYYFNLFRNPQKPSDLTSAYTFFNTHYQQSLNNQDTLRAVLDLRYMAIIQNEIGFTNDSENSAITALQLLDRLRDNEKTMEPRIGLYNHLGKIYRTLMKYDTALNYYNKVLDLAQTPNQRAVVLNNRALIYEDQDKHQLAAEEFSKAYQLASELKDTREMARALDNLGHVQSKLGISEGLGTMEKALAMRLDLQDTSGMYASYKHLTEYYKDKTDTVKAIGYAQKALDLAKSINATSYIKDALETLLGLSNDANVVEYQRINDSMTLARQQSSNAYASMKYAYDEQERLAKQNELEKEKQKRLKQLYLAIGIVIALLSIFSYLILKTKHKRDKLQQVYETETRISKKVHDEVANDVYHLMTKIEGNLNTKDQLLDDLELIYSKTRDISKDVSSIAVDGDFKESLGDLLLVYNSPEVSVVTKGLNTVNWNTISHLKKMTIYRVLQELMTNMKKHSKASIAVLRFEYLSNKLFISYKDNGLGCDLKKQNGLLNAENRIKSINGTITFESQPHHGFNVKIIV